MASDDRTLPAPVNPSGCQVERPAGIPAKGTVIADKYEIGEVLGAGGMGVVVAGRHVQLGEPVAIKFLLPRVASDPETVARFMREARAAVRVKSEHTARVTDVGQLPEGSPYLVMEHLSGHDLGRALERGGRLSIGDAVDYVLQACLAIAEAHALGLVHRDLKPSNLFLTQRSDGTPLVKVLDFGISKALAEQGAQDPALTDTQAIFGSPTYMSPEQLRSTKKVDVRTDIWALGVVLFELTTGEPPFKGETVAGLLAAISADAPDLLRAKRTDAPELLETVVARCLEKDLTKRFQNIGELATALAPLASRARQESIERIARLAHSMRPPAGAPPARISIPAESGGVPSGGAFAATEQPWTRGPTMSRSRAHPAWLALGAACLAVVAWWYASSRHPASDAPPATQSALSTPSIAPIAATSAAPVVEAATAARAAPIDAGERAPRATNDTPRGPAVDLQKTRPHAPVPPAAPTASIAPVDPPASAPAPPAKPEFDPLKTPQH